MNATSFYTRLALVTFGAAVVLSMIHLLVPAAQPHLPFAIASLALFILICIGLYYAGIQAARSSNKYAFNNLVSVTVFGKMVLAIAFLFLYQRMAHPENEWFVFIFLITYVVYTVFEVSFMMKLART